MQSIENSDLEKFSDELNNLLNEVPEMRRELHEELAQAAKEEVDSQIVASVNDASGKIRAWQEPHVGSGGGYAAVRPSDSSTGANSPGAITNYLESGHKIRKPSGNAKHYRPNIKVPYVEGRHFYEASRSAMESKAIATAERFADRLAERLERG